MKVNERREAILALLTAEQKPVAGGVLAERFGVSRQIIVQDIAALKNDGNEILATHYGYLVQKRCYCERVFKVRHSRTETEDELSCIVALGGTVANVYVWHKVYGKIQVELNISHPSHVEQFIEGVRSGKSVELMSITGGYHYHTIHAETEEILDEIGKALQDRGYIAPEV